MEAYIDGTNQNISIQLAHDILGHMDEERTRLAEKFLEYELTRGKLKPCEECTADKTKQKKLTKSSDHVPVKENYGKILLDISTIKIPKEINVLVTKLRWSIMVD